MRGLSTRALAWIAAVMAVGFLGALRRNGAQAPRDVSVVGFDNIEVCAHLSPALTTIRQPRTLIGERAADLLLDLIGGGGGEGFAGLVEVELVVRDSTAPPA